MKREYHFSENKLLDGLINHLLRVNSNIEYPNSPLKIENLIVEIFRARSKSFTLEHVPQDEQTAWIVAAAIEADPANIKFRRPDITDEQIARHLLYELKVTFKPSHFMKAYFEFFDRLKTMPETNLRQPLYEIFLKAWNILDLHKKDLIKLFSASDLVNIALDRLDGDKENVPAETLYYEALEQGVFDSCDIPDDERKKLTGHLKSAIANAAKAAKENNALQESMQKTREKLQDMEEKLEYVDACLDSRYEELEEIETKLEEFHQSLAQAKQELAREKKAAQAAIYCRVATEQETRKVLHDKIKWQMYVDRISEREAEKLALEEAEYDCNDIYSQEMTSREKWDERERRFQNWLEESIKHDQETLEWFDSI